MTSLTVLVTVQGDTGQGVVPADPDRRIGELLPAWTSHYSSGGPLEVVMVNAATSRILDPDGTLRELDLGLTPVLWLLTVEEAAVMTGALTIAGPPPAPVGDRGAADGPLRAVNGERGHTRRVVSLRGGPAKAAGPRGER